MYRPSPEPLPNERSSSLLEILNSFAMGVNSKYQKCIDVIKDSPSSEPVGHFENAELGTKGIGNSKFMIWRDTTFSKVDFQVNDVTNGPLVVWVNNWYDYINMYKNTNTFVEIIALKLWTGPRGYKV